MVFDSEKIYFTLSFLSQQKLPRQNEKQKSFALTKLDVVMVNSQH
jgi:hypothetical protein